LIMVITNQKNISIMETLQKTINGFESQAIMDTVGAIQSNPEIGKFKFRAKNKWISGGHNRSSIQDFYGGCVEDETRTEPFVFDNSEPPILLGGNEGANPVEFILHGLAGCMTTTMMLHAAANGIPVDHVESSLEGDLDVQGFLGLDDSVRNGYQNIRVNFKIEGDLSEEERMQLLSFVYKSPVFDIVTNKVPVAVSLLD
ncbi:MAG: OsmC family protein, partial [Cyclobacteriaceae bacterium]